MFLIDTRLSVLGGQFSNAKIKERLGNDILVLQSKTRPEVGSGGQLAIVRPHQHKHLITEQSVAYARKTSKSAAGACLTLQLAPYARTAFKITKCAVMIALPLDYAYARPTYHSMAYASRIFKHYACARPTVYPVAYARKTFKSAAGV